MTDLKAAQTVVPSDGESIEIEIFRAGVHKPMNGPEVGFTSTMLDAIAEAYDPSKHEAPLVIGHPGHDAPAWGWVKSLRRDGDGLKAVVRDLDPVFADMVKAGRFKKVSASFYLPSSPNSPIKRGYYLRHVGFLGAQPPAVKGLNPVSFSDVDTATYWEADMADLAEATGTKFETKILRQQLAAANARLAEFSEKEAGLRHRENAAFIAGLVKEGRFMPGYTEGMVSFLDALDPNSVVEFGEGETKPGADFFRDYLKAQPPIIHFGEYAPFNLGRDDDNDTSVTAVAKKIAQLVDEKRKAGVSISFSEAAAIVRGSAE